MTRAPSRLIMAELFGPRASGNEDVACARTPLAATTRLVRFSIF
jgi:hypothetical protein